MRRKRSSLQGDLFDTPNQLQDEQNRVKELDHLIAAALKKNDYEQAKVLTQEQESLIQKLVDHGDDSGSIGGLVS